MQYPSILEGLFTNQTTYFCLTMCVGNCETFNEFFYLHDPQFLTVAWWYCKEKGEKLINEEKDGCRSAAYHIFYHRILQKLHDSFLFDSVLYIL